MTRTRASRLGLVIAILGAGLAIYHMYTFQPRNSQRPESQQHRELVLRLEQEAEERGRKALADALAGRPVADCAPNDDACLVQKQLDEMGLGTSTADIWAKWTPDSYIRAWAGNTVRGLRYSHSFQLAVGFFVLGLYLLLLHDATFGRLVRWIQHGNQA